VVRAQVNTHVPVEVELNPIFKIILDCDITSNELCKAQLMATMASVNAIIWRSEVLAIIDRLIKRNACAEGHKVDNTNNWFIEVTGHYKPPNWGTLVDFKCPTKLPPFIKVSYKPGSPETPAICKLSIDEKELLRERNEGEMQTTEGYYKKGRIQQIETVIIPNYWTNEIVKIMIIKYREWDDTNNYLKWFVVMPKLSVHFSQNRTTINTNSVVIVDDEGNYVEISTDTAKKMVQVVKLH